MTPETVGLRVRVATFLGIGHAPFASGTVASLATLPFAALLSNLGWAAFLTGTGLAIALAFWSAGAAEAHFGAKDPHAVVIDEVAGQMVALAFVPLSVGWFACGFFLFRLFDVLKPFPAGRLERIPGGPGIVLDDLAAGLYANVVLQVARAVLTAAGPF